MKKKAVFLLIIFIFFSTLTLLFFTLDRSQDIRTRAEEGPEFCQDKCIGQDRCGPKGPPGDVNYNDPCCDEIAKTGDPGACPWPQRGYCTDSQCGAIPEGVNRLRCGAPRHSWCNLCRDNKCPGYADTPTQPTQSTQPSQPTQKPATPTQKPTLIPPTATPQTAKPQLTSIPKPKKQSVTKPIVTIPLPVQEEQKILPEEPQQSRISFPSFKFPKLQINLVRVNQTAKKPLGLFEYLFQVISKYDRKLENYINDKVQLLLEKTR